MNSKNKDVCGILFCYNEEHILADCLKYYLGQGIDLVVIDNYSTDSSMKIVESFRGDKEKYSGVIRDIIHVRTSGFEYGKILRFACSYMHEKLSHYTWILLIDADAFYSSPIRGMSLLEFMHFAKNYGYNIIDTKGCEFYPTEKDDLLISSPIERLKYCKIKPWRKTPHEQKIFLYHPTIDFYTQRAHECLRDNPRVCILKAWYKHYPWVSYEHGMKKIFQDRIPRAIIERSQNPSFHTQYLGIQPLRKDLVKDSKTLWYYQEEKMFLSQFNLRWVMKAKKFVEAYIALRDKSKKNKHLRDINGKI